MWFGKKEEKKVRPPIPNELIEAKTREFIAKKSKMVKPDEIANDTTLFSSGLLDSLAYIQLVTYLEKEFNFSFADGVGASPDLLDNIDSIVNTVKKAV